MVLDQQVDAMDHFVVAELLAHVSQFHRRPCVPDPELLFYFNRPYFTDEGRAPSAAG